jgi:hypothetical protein
MIISQDKTSLRHSLVINKLMMSGHAIFREIRTEDLCVSLTIFILYDFVMKLLSYGTTVEVIQQQSLIDGLKRIYERARRNIKKVLTVRRRLTHICIYLRKMLKARHSRSRKSGKNLKPSRKGGK